MICHTITRVSLVVLCAGIAMGAPQGKKGRSKDGRNQPTQNSKCNDAPAHPLDVVLGRPTRDSVLLSVLAYQDAEGIVAYGTEWGHLTQKTPPQQFKKGEPTEIAIRSLQPNTRYFYQLSAGSLSSRESTFHTQRLPNSSFTFTITADSHLDDRVSAELYQRTLANALADAPDFHIDLGDTFMSEKHDGRTNAARQYLAQRYYFGQLCHSAPLFLVLGNHDGESPRGRGNDAEGLAVWSNQMRKRYFPNPVPDDFYSGNATRHPQAGLLQDYFAWEWGDALFVALDPFWFSQRQHGKGDNWSRSLGQEQYHWLKRTLEASKAKYKFVFIHHLVGGATPEGRGGVEAAPLYEWGGKNPDGSDGFPKNRPGWPTPIHPLLVENHVTAVFHGHDHLYVKQDLDGIVYQEAPQPGNPRGNTRTATEYGYTSGVLQASSGHLRVRVAPTRIVVDYVRACLPEDERSDRRNASIAHSYTIPAKPATAGPSPTKHPGE